MNASPTRARVASSVPGRLRLKLTGERRHVDAERAAAHLQDHPGVAAASAHPSIGSVTVHYDTERTTVDQILAALHALGMPIGRQGDLPPDLPADAGRSHAAVRITEALDRLDRRISVATARRVDLKFLFPAGFLIFGVRNTLVKGLGLTTIPGYIMLWYAFDAFYKLHQEVPAMPKRARSAERGLVPAEGRRTATPS